MVLQRGKHLMLGKLIDALTILVLAGFAIGIVIAVIKRPEAGEG